MVLTAIVLAALAMQACATAPSVETIDTLGYIIGAPETWPRHGLPNHYQHQNVDADLTSLSNRPVSSR